MLKIVCKNCGELVVKGMVANVPTKRGIKTKFMLDESEKPQGQIMKNHSNDPYKWEGLCSKCQSSIQAL